MIEYLKHILDEVRTDLEPHIIYYLKDITRNESGELDIICGFKRIGYSALINDTFQGHIRLNVTRKLKQYVMGDIKYHVGLKRMVNSE
jgi:hypothetical protein